MTEEKVLCQGTRMDGSPCTRHHSPGAKMCAWHQPERVEERARALEAQVAAVRANLSVTAQ